MQLLYSIIVITILLSTPNIPNNVNVINDSTCDEIWKIVRDQPCLYMYQYYNESMSEVGCKIEFICED